MMKITILFLLFLPMIAFSQDVETVKISKSQTWLFRGQGQEIGNCYLYMDEAGAVYFATLSISQSEVNQWFNARKDSQNIYKGMLQNGQYKTLTLVKDNEPGMPLSFYYERKEKSEIQLVSIEDGRVYVFRQVMN